MNNYLFIGDIHSQNRPLVKALATAKELGLIPVLLGDVFDSRCSVDQTLEVFQTIFSYGESSPLYMVQSNHQWKLLQYFQGNRKLGVDFQGTALKLMPYKAIIEKWFSALPFGFVLRATRGRTYKVAHAQFPSRFTEDLILRSNSNSKVRGLCLYGSRTATNERVEWWLSDEEKERDWIRVAGHYHTVFKGNNSLVLDGCCGDPGGYLVAYDTLTEELLWWEV